MYAIKIRQRQDYYYDVLVLNNSKLYISKRKTDWETAKIKAQVWSYYFNNARIEVE